MKTQLDISKLLEIGKIQNELDFERALIADRKLRILSKEDSKYKTIRKSLRDLIETYENKNWSSDSIITNKHLKESDLAELIAEKERLFIKNRKELIKKRIKSINLTQQDLGEILGPPWHRPQPGPPSHRPGPGPGWPQPQPRRRATRRRQHQRCPYRPFVVKVSR